MSTKHFPRITAAFSLSNASLSPRPRPNLLRLSAVLIGLALASGPILAPWASPRPALAQDSAARWTNAEFKLVEALRSVDEATAKLKANVATSGAIGKVFGGAAQIPPASAPAKIDELAAAAKKARIKTIPKPGKTPEQTREIGLKVDIDAAVESLRPPTPSEPVGATKTVGKLAAKTPAKPDDTGGELYAKLSKAYNAYKIEIASGKKIRPELREMYAHATILLGKGDGGVKNEGSLAFLTDEATVAANGLKAKVDATPAAVQALPTKFAKKAETQVAALYGGASNAPVAASTTDVWRKTLIPNGTDFADLVAARRDLPRAMAVLQADFDLTSLTGAEEKDYVAFDSSAKALYIVLPDGLSHLRTEDGRLRERAAAQIDIVGRNPDDGVPGALSLGDTIRPVTDADEKVRVIVERLTLEYNLLDKGSKIKVAPPYDLAGARSSFEETLRNLLVALTRLGAAKTMSRRTWTEEYIRLYNTDRVDVVLDAIASGGKSFVKVTSDDAPSREAVEKARADSEAAAQTVVNSQQKVNDLRAAFRRRLIELVVAKEAAADRRDDAAKVEDANRTARLDAAGLNASDAETVAQANAELTRLRALRVEAERQEAQATKDRVGKEADEPLRAAETEARRKRADAESAVVEAQRALDLKTVTATTGKSVRTAEETEANAKKTAAQKSFDDADAEVKAITTKMDAAQTELTAANQELGKASSQAYQLALLDNVIFARARDNAPYFVLAPTSDEAGVDPMRRAVVFGYPAERAIFVRGSRDDVSRIRRLVNRLDRPQAQAKLSLWTLELTATSTSAGLDTLQDSIGKVKEHITDINFQTAAVMTHLKSAVQQTIQSGSASPSNGSTIRNALKAKLNVRLANQEKANETFSATLSTQRVERLNKALDFVDDGVLSTLGARPELLDNAGGDLIWAVLPDPEDVNSLAEALVLLSLADPARQGEAFGKFLTFTGSAEDADRFRHLKAFLGSWQTSGTKRQWVPSAEIVGFQRELIGVLRRRSVDTFTDYLVRLAARRDQTKARLAGEKNAGEKEKIEKDLAIVLDRMRTAADWLFGGVGTLTPNEIEFRVQTSSPERILLEVDDFLRNSPNYPQYANARAANLDASLKRLMGALDRDLSEMIIGPKLACLRKAVVTAQRGKSGEMKQESYSVGILQETALLVSNRLVSRMDPSASASLVPTIQDSGAADVLNLTGQLALLGSGLGAGGVVSGLSGSLGSLAQSAGMNIPGLASGAASNGTATAGQTGGEKKKSSDESPDLSPGVYAITTGNVFQVTPIFDPTGQAMRFRFDYVAASAIREPDGSVDPQLPRIQRNNINTQVNLGNQEIGIVAEYQSNASIGLPARRDGGLPVLKNLDLFKDVPLIGWFSKRKSANPATMYSLVFCRTSMYPGIEDIVDLISRPILRVGDYQTTTSATSGTPNAGAGK